MAAWKILITDGLDAKGKAVLEKAGTVADRNGISPDDLLKEISEYDALIVRSRTKVTPAVLAAGTRLKVVGRAGIGVDNIDLAAAEARGITVVNSPLATTVTVAELALGMMLSLAREIPRADSAIKAGKWLKKELEGTELFGKTLGVIGFGRIGSTMAKRASAFDMQVLAYDRLKDANETRLHGGNPVELDELLASSDFISLHLPLTPDTKNMLNAEAFAKMKDGVYIINASRGGIVDEDALLAAFGIRARWPGPPWMCLPPNRPALPRWSAIPKSFAPRTLALKRWKPRRAPDMTLPPKSSLPSKAKHCAGK